MKHENVDFQYSDMVICCKSYYNRVVLPLASNIARMNGCSTVLCRLKGSATKAPVLCPNIVKFYKKGMREVDFIDQKQQAAAYRLDWKSKLRFYFRNIFDWLNVALVNSYIVYQKLGQTDLTILDFKIVIANSLIGKDVNCQKAFSRSCPNKRRSLEKVGPSDIPTHTPAFQFTARRCNYCRNEGFGQ